MNSYKQYTIFMCLGILVEIWLSGVAYGYSLIDNTRLLYIALALLLCASILIHIFSIVSAIQQKGVFVMLKGASIGVLLSTVVLVFATYLTAIAKTEGYLLYLGSFIICGIMLGLGWLLNPQNPINNIAYTHTNHRKEQRSS